MKIAYVFASRSRPDKFFGALDNIRTQSASDNYFIIAKLDTDDLAMNNPEIIERLKGYPEVAVKWGLSKSKIDAINRDLEDLPACDIIICMSDDMLFVKYGFDDSIRRAMPSDLGGFLHFPDSYAGSRVCTMSIMGKKYFDRFGYIYHQAYNSLWCDNEATDVAKILDKYLFVSERILEHVHYSNKQVAKDDLYKRNDTYRADEQIYLARKEKNFDLIGSHTNAATA